MLLGEALLTANCTPVLVSLDISGKLLPCVILFFKSIFEIPTDNWIYNAGLNALSAALKRATNLTNLDLTGSKSTTPAITPHHHVIMFFTGTMIDKAIELSEALKCTTQLKTLMIGSETLPADQSVSDSLMSRRKST